MVQIITVCGIRWHQWLAWQQHFSRYFLFHFPNKSILSLPCLFSPLTMYNKKIIGFGFSGMQNYQCLSKSYLPSAQLITLTSTLIIPHITKTSSNNCLLFCIVVYSCILIGREPTVNFPYFYSGVST